MEPGRAKMVVTAAVMAGLVGVLLGWQASSGGGRSAATEVVRGAGYVHPNGSHLYIDTDLDGGSDYELGGLATANWWDGETWRGDNMEQDCLPKGAQPGDEPEEIEAGVVSVPPFGDGIGTDLLVWFRCPDTF